MATYVHSHATVIHVYDDHFPTPYIIWITLMFYCSMLSQTIHALASLLYPFRWQHTYIPVLPESMLDVCCSPTPYIIGILSSQLSYVQTLPISEVSFATYSRYCILRSTYYTGKCATCVQCILVHLSLRLKLHYHDHALSVVRPSFVIKFSHF